MDKRASSCGAGEKGSDQEPEVCTILKTLLKKCTKLQKEFGGEMSVYWEGACVSEEA